MVLKGTDFWALPEVMQIAVPVLVEALLDTVDDGHCKFKGILNPASHAKTKKNIFHQ